MFLLFKRAAIAFISSHASIMLDELRGWIAMFRFESSAVVVEVSTGSAAVAIAGFGGGETVP